MASLAIRVCDPETLLFHKKKKQAQWVTLFLKWLCLTSLLCSCLCMKMEKGNESQIMGEKITGGTLAAKIVCFVEHEQATKKLSLKP